MPQEHRLLAEWAAQEAVILAWPDELTDWAPWLEPVRETYKALISAITEAQTGVILLVRDDQIAIAKEQLQGCSRVLLVNADYNDTWCRDYAFLTCESEKGKQPIEFTFNGWGNKFDASKDNLVNQQVLSSLCYLPLVSYPLVAEGGALEIDEQGNLLSTSLCLLNPQRNGELRLEQYEQHFKQALGATSVSIFQHGHLEGDDTDGHIDTIVRFTPKQGLVIQSCFNRPEDSHFEGLRNLVDECRARFVEHQIFELPLPKIINQQGERLPASYANYLICNELVLCPIYQQLEDDIALEIIRKAYPEHRIIAINSLPLVQQFGSIHCISMQVPEGTLRQAVTSQFQQGVNVYAK